MKIPNNWNDFYNQDHNNKEIQKGVLKEFQYYIKNYLSNFDLNFLLEKGKDFFKSKKLNKIKVAINQNSNQNYIEFLLITEISKRLIRIIPNESFKISNENLITIGHENFFQIQKFLF